jgi:Tfp pilus assembly protein PilV
MDLMRNDKGFTLLEAAIALVILLIIGLGIASLFTYALGANTRADDRELAMTIAQKRMESLRTIPFTHKPEC